MSAFQLRLGWVIASNISSSLFLRCKAQLVVIAAIFGMQMGSEMIAKDVNTISLLAGAPAKEAQEDQLVMTAPDMMDSVDSQLTQETIAGEIDDVSVPVATVLHEKGQEITVDLFAKYMEMEAHDWHNRLRNSVLALISFVPKVGAAVSKLIGFFWPANKVDIWEAINGEKYVRNIVQQEIFKFEMQQHQSEILALERTVMRYDTAAPNEKGNFLSIWISQADRLCIALTRSTNNIHLLLHIVTVAVLHVAALHERLTFGEELYGSSNNTEAWTKDLVDLFQMYTSTLIPDIFKKWKQWRESQIEIKQWIQPGSCGINSCRPNIANATVEDKISGEMFTFRASSSPYVIPSLLAACTSHKTRMMNEAIADMASCLSPTFAFHKLLPDDIQPQFSPYDKELFGRVFRGPYSQDLLQPLFPTAKAFRMSTTRDDQTARDRILEVIIRAGHHVDAIQFVYDHVNPNATTPGLMAGNSAGGVRYPVDVRNRSIHELRMEFYHDVLASLQLRFEDGTSTRKFGNLLGWASSAVTCTVPYGYRLSSWAFREDPGPYQTTAISVLRFQFIPEDLSP